MTEIMLHSENNVNLFYWTLPCEAFLFYERKEEWQISGIRAILNKNNSGAERSREGEKEV